MVFSTQATFFPSSESTGELPIPLVVVPLVVLYAHLTVGAKPQSPPVG